MTNTLRWTYVAETSLGKRQKGSLIATDQSAALKQLRAVKLTPIFLKQSSRNTLNLGFSSGRKNIAPSDLVDFSRGLADLLEAGVPVGRALDLLAGQATKKSIKPLLQEIAIAVRQGKTLSDALRSAPQTVPRLVVAMTVAGENTGRLGNQFKMLADHYEAQFKLRRELIAQAIYPAALFVLIVLTIIFLSNFVLPQFETIFSNADTLPPPETRFVMATGSWIREKAAFFPAFLLISLISGKFLLNRYAILAETLLFNTPFLGSLWRNIIAGRCCRSLGALLLGGAPLSTALEITRQTISFESVGDRYDLAQKEIRSGTALSNAFAKQNLFPDNTIGFARLGEESGTLGLMLLKAGDRCEQDVKANLTKLTRLIGPLMTAIMGLLTAGVIAAVMSGVLSLNETVY